MKKVFVLYDLEDEEYFMKIEEAKDGQSRISTNHNIKNALSFDTVELAESALKLINEYYPQFIWLIEIKPMYVLG